jgi:hypothetical protein
VRPSLLISLLTFATAAPLTWSSAEPMTWVFVLETAGPALPIANATRDGLARLVEVLPEGDRVEVQVVHTRTSTLVDRTISSADRATLAADLRALELPTAKATDMGAALSHLSSRLAASPGPRQIVIVGSFCHQPPIGSPWADGGYGCRSILGFDALNTEFDGRGGLEATEVHLFPVDLVGQPSDPRGVSQAEALFNPGVVSVEPIAFSEWVTSVAPHVETLRTRPRARAEVDAFAVTATVLQAATEESPRARVELTANLTHMGFAVSAMTVGGGRLVAPATVLEPSATIEVDVDVPAPPFSLVPRTDVVEVPLTLHLEGSLTPEAGVTQLGIDPQRPAQDIAVVVYATRSYGLSPARGGAILASLLLFGGAGTLALRRQLTPIQLGGAFTYRRSGGARQALDIAGRSEAAIVVLADGSLGLGKKEDAIIVLRMERPLWTARASAWIRIAGVELNARPVSTGWHRIVAGATSFQFQEYRLSWE